MAEIIVSTPEDTHEFEKGPSGPYSRIVYGDEVKFFDHPSQDFGKWRIGVDLRVSGSGEIVEENGYLHLTPESEVENELRAHYGDRLVRIALIQRLD